MDNDQDLQEDATETSVQNADHSLDQALRLKAKKPVKKIVLTKKHILYGTGGFFALLLILMVYSCGPKQGSMAYGICSTFLEMNTPYPNTLEYTGVESSRTAVRIYFTQIDPFGQLKQEMMECAFEPDEQLGLRLSKISRNRRAINSDIVKTFNKTLPAVIEGNPYRVMPPDWKNPLRRE